VKVRVAMPGQSSRRSRSRSRKFVRKSVIFEGSERHWVRRARDRARVAWLAIPLLLIVPRRCGTSKTRSYVLARDIVFNPQTTLIGPFLHNEEDEGVIARSITAVDSAQNSES
jgi:hypothetical protein